MDVLNDIIDTLELKGALYFRTDFTPPFGIAVPQYEQAARFHLVVQGRCFVKLPSGQMVELEAGDLILIPAGADHVLCSAPEVPAPPLETVIKDSGYSGSGVFTLGEANDSASAQMVCGHFTFRAGADHPLLRAMPEYLHITNAARAKNPWLDDVLRLVVKQIFADPENSSATVTRLSEVIFIEALRAAADQAPALTKIIGALKQRQLSEALLLMHERLDEAWTMEKLAAAVGMSRSKFAEQFRIAIGCAPMRYLSDWRIQKAISLLAASQLSVQQVAAKTGYQSPAAFTRAFSQKMGVSPMEFRRQDNATLH